MEQHIIKLDNETMYMNLHTIVFPDTRYTKTIIDAAAEKHKAVANYSLNALVNVIFSSKEDAYAFYKELNG